MKTGKKIFLLVLFGCAGNLYAQPLLSSRNTAKKLPFGQPPPALSQASDLIVKASIPNIKTPFVVKLNPGAQLQQAKEQCPFLHDAEPTLHLEGERSTNSMVKLDWETTNGRNNASFFIQRSLGDTFHFETVNSVWAKQVAGIRDTYHQPDENQYNKVSYYRVRLQLRDGSLRYSNIAAVKGYQVDEVKLFPNPGVGPVRLTLYSDQAGIAVIRTYDAAGKLASQQTETIVAGFNNRELDVARLAGGYYKVRVEMPDKSEKSASLIRQ